MSKFRQISILIMLLTAWVGTISGQQTEINADTFNVRNFREEIYIQTDRDIYVTGEPVWMKVWKFDRLTSLPVNESKVVYLELLDNSGNILKQLKISVNGCSAAANLRLSDTLSTGNYLIRAYSNWMQNYSEDLFFYKYISVINPFRNIEKLISHPGFEIPDSVRFFPEGGKLLKGIRNKVAVRSTGFDGSPVKMEGVIVNEKGKIICPVRTDSLGFGVFTIVPVAGEKLSVQFKTPGGSVKTRPLPVVAESGMTIVTEYLPANSLYKIRLLKAGFIQVDPKNVRLIVLSGGLIVYQKEIDAGTDTLITLNCNKLPAGSAHLILVDNAGKRLTDRWIYNKTDEGLNFAITLPKEEFKPREKISFEISASGRSGEPLVSDLSVSVVKKSLKEKGLNIMNREEYTAMPGEWLTDLPQDEMNNRLLAYRSVSELSELVQPGDSLPDHMPELGGQLVNGVLKNRLNHEPLKATDISLSFVGKTAICHFLKTGRDGEFNFIVNKPGLSEIVIQPLKPVSSGYYVEFNQPFCTTFSDHIPPVFNLDSTRTDDINKAVISMQINNIYEPFRSEHINENVAPKIHDFYGEPDKTINLSDYIELTTVKEVLREIVPDIIVVRRNKEYAFKLVNLPVVSSENSPLVLVDGVPFYNLGKLLEVNSKEIEHIDILNSRYYFTDYVFEGIVSFTTRKGNLSAMDYDNSVFRQVFEGCQQPLEFYSPDYDKDKTGTYRIPDFRNTLYWKPDLKSDRSGKTSVSFFTSDEPGEYIITVEGATPDGKVGMTQARMVVK